MTERSRRLAAMIALASLLAGCPPPRAIDFGPRGRITDPHVALQAVVARRARIDTVRGEAKVSIEAPKGGGRVTELVAAAAPDRLRLETLSFFGDPLAVLTTDGAEFQLHDEQHHRFIEGPATPADASRLLPVPLDARDVVSLLLGVPPLLPNAPELHLLVDERERTYALILAKGPAAEAIGLDPMTLRPVWVRMNAFASRTAFEARFENYDADTDLPRRVTLETDRPATKVDLRWRDREINATLPDAIFQQPVPPGLTPESSG